jgi:YVTN family beta-propeller protein
VLCSISRDRAAKHRYELIMSRHALLIAAGRYTDQSLQRLRSPAQDVKRLAEILRNPNLGGFDDVKVSIDQREHELRLAIENILSDRLRDDLVLLYLSCHGVQDRRGRLYFAATNTRLNRLAATALGSAFVDEQLSNSVAGGRVLILDCCFSGSFARGLAVKSSVGSPLADKIGRGCFVLTATDAFEYAFEGESPRGVKPRLSVCTEAIIAGLDSGLADRDGDGWVSTQDLYDYVYDVMKQKATQTPTYFASNVEGRLLLARVPTARSSTGRDATAPPVREAPATRKGRSITFWTILGSAATVLSLLVTILTFLASSSQAPAPGPPTAHLAKTIPVADSPSSLAIAPDGRYAYVTHLSGTMSVIDTATNVVTATTDVGSGALGVAVTPDGRHAYVAHWGSALVSVINTATNTVTVTVDIGGDRADNPVGVAVTPDGRRAYVTNRGSGTVSVINTATNTVTATVRVQGGPNGVAVAPEGRYVYVTNEGSDSVSVIDTMNNAVTATINVGKAPVTVAVAPDSHRAYVVDRASIDFSTLSVIDTAANTVITTLDIGGDPGAVVVTPDGHHAYVTNGRFNAVSVIDTGI